MTHEQQVPRGLRKTVFERDGRRCVNCGDMQNITIQRRQATGMGGSKKLLTSSDCITLCAVCNALCEANADFQQLALRFGYKVRRNIGVLTCGDVPVFYRLRFEWCLIDSFGGLPRPISEVRAHELIELANLVSFSVSETRSSRG